MRYAIILVLCSIPWLAVPSLSQSPPAEPSRISDLNYFLGDWGCAGKFTRSGKSIEARQHFEAILNKSFVLFQHDDKPPHSYHAWAEWGWDAAGKLFVSTVQDSTGGTRLFHSPGWQGGQLTWSGGSPSQAEDQQFVFEKISAHEFRVSYATRKDGNWTSVDESTCTQTDAKNTSR